MFDKNRNRRSARFSTNDNETAGDHPSLSKTTAETAPGFPYQNRVHPPVI
jgi:hypothetical protein